MKVQVKTQERQQAAQRQQATQDNRFREILAHFAEYPDSGYVTFDYKRNEAPMDISIPRAVTQVAVYRWVDAATGIVYPSMFLVIPRCECAEGAEETSCHHAPLTPWLYIGPRVDGGTSVLVVALPKGVR